MKSNRSDGFYCHEYSRLSLVFAIADYMKVSPENESQYIGIEKEIYKPLHHELIKAGSRLCWSYGGTFVEHLAAIIQKNLVIAAKTKTFHF